jgi:hypothetical protein
MRTIPGRNFDASAKYRLRLAVEQVANCFTFAGEILKLCATTRTSIRGWQNLKLRLGAFKCFPTMPDVSRLCTTLTAYEFFFTQLRN